MTHEELVKRLSTTLTKATIQKLSALAAAGEIEFEDLNNLCFYPQKEVAFRAAWLLETSETEAPDRFLEILNQFLTRYPNQESYSCQRHFTKIMMRLTEKSTSAIYQFKLRDYNFETVIDTTFEWLINPKTPIAVKVNCIEILVNLRTKSDWIEEELTAQIEFLLKDGGPAIQSRGKKMLKVLDRR